MFLILFVNFSFADSSLHEIHLSEGWNTISVLEYNLIKDQLPEDHKFLLFSPKKYLFYNYNTELNKYLRAEGVSQEDILLRGGYLKVDRDIVASLDVNNYFSEINPLKINKGWNFFLILPNMSVDDILGNCELDKAVFVFDSSSSSYWAPHTVSELRNPSKINKIYFKTVVSKFKDDCELYSNIPSTNDVSGSIAPPDEDNELPDLPEEDVEVEEPLRWYNELCSLDALSFVENSDGTHSYLIVSGSKMAKYILEENSWSDIVDLCNDKPFDWPSEICRPTALSFYEDPDTKDKEYFVISGSKLAVFNISTEEWSDIVDLCNDRPYDWPSEVCRPTAFTFTVDKDGGYHYFVFSGSKVATLNVSSGVWSNVHDLCSEEVYGWPSEVCRPTAISFYRDPVTKKFGYYIFSGSVAWVLNDTWQRAGDACELEEPGNENNNEIPGSGEAIVYSYGVVVGANERGIYVDFTAAEIEDNGFFNDFEYTIGEYQKAIENYDRVYYSFDYLESTFGSENMEFRDGCSDINEIDEGTKLEWTTRIKPGHERIQERVEFYSCS